jgi:hypothetical protein
MSYRMSGELPSGASYDVLIQGPIPAWMLGKLINLLELYKIALEEDEKIEHERKLTVGEIEFASWIAEDGKPPVTPYPRGHDHCGSPHIPASDKEIRSASERSDVDSRDAGLATGPQNV